MTRESAPVSARRAVPARRTRRKRPAGSVVIAVALTLLSVGSSTIAGAQDGGSVVPISDTVDLTAASPAPVTSFVNVTPEEVATAEEIGSIAAWADIEAYVLNGGDAVAYVAPPGVLTDPALDLATFDSRAAVFELDCALPGRETIAAADGTWAVTFACLPADIIEFMEGEPITDHRVRAMRTLANEERIGWEWMVASDGNVVAETAMLDLSTVTGIASTDGGLVFDGLVVDGVVSDGIVSGDTGSGETGSAETGSGNAGSGEAGSGTDGEVSGAGELPEIPPVGTGGVVEAPGAAGSASTGSGGGDRGVGLAAGAATVTTLTIAGGVARSRRRRSADGPGVGEPGAGSAGMRSADEAWREVMEFEREVQDEARRAVNRAFGDVARDWRDYTDAVTAYEVGFAGAAAGLRDLELISDQAAQSIDAAKRADTYIGFVQLGALGVQGLRLVIVKGIPKAVGWARGLAAGADELATVADDAAAVLDDAAKAYDDSLSPAENLLNGFDPGRMVESGARTTDEWRSIGLSYESERARIAYLCEATGEEIRAWMAQYSHLDYYEQYNAALAGLLQRLAHQQDLPLLRNDWTGFFAHLDIAVGNMRHYGFDGASGYSGWLEIEHLRALFRTADETPDFIEQLRRASTSHTLLYGNSLGSVNERSLAVVELLLGSDELRAVVMADDALAAGQTLVRSDGTAFPVRIVQLADGTPVRLGPAEGFPGLLDQPMLRSTPDYTPPVVRPSADPSELAMPSDSVVGLAPPRTPGVDPTPPFTEGPWGDPIPPTYTGGDPIPPTYTGRDPIPPTYTGGDPIPPTSAGERIPDTLAGPSSAIPPTATPGRGAGRPGGALADAPNPSPNRHGPGRMSPITPPPGTTDDVPTTIDEMATTIDELAPSTPSAAASTGATFPSAPDPGMDAGYFGFLAPRDPGLADVLRRTGQGLDDIADIVDGDAPRPDDLPAFGTDRELLVNMGARPARYEPFGVEAAGAAILNDVVDHWTFHRIPKETADLLRSLVSAAKDDVLVGEHDATPDQIQAGVALAADARFPHWMVTSVAESSELLGTLWTPAEVELVTTWLRNGQDANDAMEVLGPIGTEALYSEGFFAPEGIPTEMEFEPIGVDQEFAPAHELGPGAVNRLATDSVGQHLFEIDFKVSTEIMAPFYGATVAGFVHPDWGGQITDEGSLGSIAMNSAGFVLAAPLEGATRLYWGFATGDQEAQFHEDHVAEIVAMSLAVKDAHAALVELQSTTRAYGTSEGELSRYPGQLLDVFDRYAQVFESAPEEWQAAHSLQWADRRQHLLQKAAQITALGDTLDELAVQLELLTKVFHQELFYPDGDERPPSHQFDPRVRFLLGNASVAVLGHLSRAVELPRGPMPRSRPRGPVALPTDAERKQANFRDYLDHAEEMTEEEFDRLPEAEQARIRAAHEADEAEYEKVVRGRR